MTTKKPNVLHEFGKPFCEYMSDTYGGEQVIFPVGPMAELKKRGIQAELLAKRGYSTNDIVKIVGLSHRSVQYKKAKAKNSVQMSLF